MIEGILANGINLVAIFLFTCWTHIQRVSTLSARCYLVLGKSVVNKTDKVPAVMEFRFVFRDPKQ